ncbi:MAG: HAMP domain-containing histidine kinase [Gammaproteobacteria bacterium]|nr:HAMP domain-containing histidine kinase [Gammaproteobacteria bacterium]
MQVNLSNRLSLILFAGYATVLLLMAMTLSVTLQSSTSVKNHTQSVLQTEIPKMLEMVNLERQLYESLNTLNEYLLSGEIIDRARFHKSMHKLQAKANEYIQFDTELKKTVKELLQNYQKKADQVIELREDDQNNYLGIAKASELLNPYHQQFMGSLDSIIFNKLNNISEDDNDIIILLTKIRNSWNNMIMALRIYFTTRADRDYRQIFFYQEQNIKDMKILLKIKSRLNFDEYFVDELADIHKIYMKNLPEVLELYQTDKWRLDTFIIRNEIYPITNSLRHALESLIVEKKKMTQGESLKLSDELDYLNNISKSTFFSSLIIGFFAIYVVIRNIRSMFKELEQSRYDSVIRSEMLQKRTNELAESLEILQTTQSQLVEHEKMAALGNLVAGMAHEINTPIGIGVTASSHITEITEKLEKKFEEGTIKKSDFIDYIKDTKESNNIMLTNLCRAADLINSFKQIAVDQSSEELREFELCDYLHEIHNSLIPAFKKTNIKIVIKCEKNILMESYPGAISQVLTNLMMNSLIHGYNEGEFGEIKITTTTDGEANVILDYQDDGKGMDKETLSKIFDPFFTTKRGEGGSGLGMHLLYNLTSQKLLGKVNVKSTLNHGVNFSFNFPITIKPKES